MRQVELLAQVDETKCIGCRDCERVCGPWAIKVEKKKAVVNEDRCFFCAKCLVECPEGAISAVPREQPLIIGIDPMEVDQEEILKLCEKARLEPEEHICICTGTFAKEAAAAVLKGAKTPEDVSFMTGVRSGCGLWCMTPIQRLLEAYGVQLIPPKDRWYKVESAIWNISEEVAHKYPRYCLGEDKQLYENGTFDNLAKIFLK
jgi:ferredoxin